MTSVMKTLWGLTLFGTVACAQIPNPDRSPTGAVDPASIDVISEEDAKECKHVGVVTEKATDPGEFRKNVEKAAIRACEKAATVGDSVVLEIPEESNISQCKGCVKLTVHAYQCNL